MASPASVQNAVECCIYDASEGRGEKDSAVTLGSDRSVTLAQRVGSCGTIYCIFVEGTEGEFKRLFIKGAMGKNTPCGEAWLEPIAKILTFALRRSLFEGSVDRGIIRQLRGVRCNNIAPNGDHITSCPDAIAKILTRYLLDRYPHLIKK